MWLTALTFVSVRRMIYPRSFAGLPTLFTFAGSALPRAIIPGLMSTMLTVLFLCFLTYRADDGKGYLEQLYAHPYPYAVFVHVVGFALVFRLNVSYNRYWDGIMNLRQMSCQWGNAAVEVLSFDCHSKPGQEVTLETRALFFALVVHRFSLLHALACSHLRREVRLGNRPAAPLDLSIGGAVYAESARVGSQAGQADATLMDARRPIKSHTASLPGGQGNCVTNLARACCGASSSERSRR